MLFIVVMFSVAVLLVIWLQVRWGNAFVRLYRDPPRSVPDSCLPHVGVILSVRGADPYLEDCLRGLMGLDYPSHEVRIVVDSRVDPAFEVVSRVCAEFNFSHVTVELLELAGDTCSLKNSALLQAMNGCSEQCEAFAWLDSDTVPYPQWLSDLVMPLQDESNGAACGIRWFAPPDSAMANYVRHLWNAGAVVQMVAFQIGWGGAFAIRKTVVADTGLKELWGRALTEDTIASDAVLTDGKRVAFVAASTMPNCESATLSWCFSFVTRQLQVLRYYHRAWPQVVFFGAFSGIALAGCMVSTVVAGCQGDVSAMGIGGGSLLLFSVVVGWLMRRAESEIGKCVEGRMALAPAGIWRLVAAAPIAQLVLVVAMIRAHFGSLLVWRGIRYRVRSGMDITRENYEPYVPETDSVNHSL